VLIGLREFQEDKADVIHKYNTDEARNLQSLGELPASARINQTAVDMAMDDGDDDDDDNIFDFEKVFFFFFFNILLRFIFSFKWIYFYRN
jgi:translation initiation factor 1A